MLKSNTAHSLLLVILLTICSKGCYSKGFNVVYSNLYELKFKNKIRNGEVLETLPTQSKIQCGSLCNKKSGCIGFGIRAESCSLLKHWSDEDNCSEDCADALGMMVYTRKDFSPFTTTTEVAITTPTTKTTTEKTTTEKATTENTTKKTTKKPSDKCRPPGGFAVIDGLATKTKFFFDSKYHKEYHCEGNGSHELYVGSAGPKIEGTPPNQIRCPNPELEGATRIHVIVEEKRVNSYYIKCSRYKEGVIDKEKQVFKLSSAPNNHFVRCGKHAILVALQLIQQKDEVYEARIECKPMVPQ